MGQSVNGWHGDLRVEECVRKEVLFFILAGRGELAQAVGVDALDLLTDGAL